jgi:hypothetical protein
MYNKLKDIRKELMLGVEEKDFLYIKMQINRIDTLLNEISQEKERGFSIDSINSKTPIVVVGGGMGKTAHALKMMELAQETGRPILFSCESKEDNLLPSELLKSKLNESLEEVKKLKDYSYSPDSFKDGKQKRRDRRKKKK